MQVAAVILLSIILCASNVLAQSPAPDCSAIEQDSWFINNPDNCRAYWYCADRYSQPRADMCPEGFHFDESNQICNSPALYPCVDDETTEPPTVPTPNPPQLGICEGKNDGHFVNNPTGCRSYFVCINEIAHPGQCPMGYNFNEALQICDRPSGTPCTNENFECPLWGISSWEKPGSCTEYNFCFAGYHRVQTCADGLHFDSERQICRFIEDVQCRRDLCPVVNDIDNIVTFPSETSCEQFYICYSGNPELWHCGEGIHWNQENQRCERPEDANCQLPPIDPEDPTDEPTEEPTTEETTTEEPTTEEPTEPPVIIECPPDFGGANIVPHPTDCQAFFVCNNEIPNEIRCPDGLLFDPSKLTCNFSENVVCPVDTSKHSKRKSGIWSDFLKMLK